MYPINSESIEKYLLGPLDPPERRTPIELMNVRPQPKQERLLEACGLLDFFYNRGPVKPAVCSIIGYGGWKYGAKTFGKLILAATAALAYPGVQITFLRRTYSQIFGPGGAINDAQLIFGSLGKWRDEYRQHDFENGSKFYFRHCENESDVYTYDGQSWDIVLFDEATHFSWFIVNILLKNNRVSGPNGIPRPFTVMGTNPGNIGHSMYYQLFDVGRKITGEAGNKNYEQVKEVVDAGGQVRTTYFIPSKLSDNKIGIERDPEYAGRLLASDPTMEDEQLWETYAGQMFKEFDRTKHVIPMQFFPPEWPVITGTDGGYADPFCNLWAKIEPRTGRIYVFREIYQAGVTEDVQAERIQLAETKEEKVYVRYGDPDYFWKSKNIKGLIRTAADDYLDKGLFLTKGDGDRKNGVRKIHQALAKGADGKPLLQITENCYNLIDELPKLPVDPNNPEDVDPKTDKDHAFSALKYLMTNVEIYVQKGSNPQAQGMNPMMRAKGL